MPLVLFEREDGMLRVSLNRVSALNAVNRALLLELKQGLEEHAQEKGLNSLLLFGRGGCFASGADIRELASFDEPGIRNFHHLRESTFALLESFALPTIALVQRYALGTGLELALCCDFRIAAADARFGVPSAKLGIVESYEYFSRVVRAVGPAWAKRMMYTGEQVDAETAWKIGLAEEISPPDEIFERAQAMVSRIQGNSLASIQGTKKVIGEYLEDPQLLKIQDRARPMVNSIISDDFREGANAFLEKRRKN